jgi:hypothetical protein
VERINLADQDTDGRRVIKCTFGILVAAMKIEVVLGERK